MARVAGGIGENRKGVRRAIHHRLLFLGDFRVEVVAARKDAVVTRAVRELLA